ncbi:MAG: type II toxin-antitoxin system VapC family toxin [Treponema sp.]|nr:type II toxin-antitoxin system VapC family toxin [Treponema sp.]
MGKSSLLLDTHVILWLVSGNKKLSEQGRNLIKENIDSIYYSIASMWEIQIKFCRKKIDVSGTEFMHYCEMAGFHKLPIDDLHIVELGNLVRDEKAPPHNDPFDRILLSQAKAEGFDFITHDPLFRGYNENCVIEV